MYYAERQKKILDYLKLRPSVSVVELSAEFGVSTVTIRKDLNRLSELGEIERTHGGAMSISKSSYEPEEDAKEAVNKENKLSIASRAVELVEPGSTIILDAGSTTQELARMLVERAIPDVTVITHALNIANIFRDNDLYHLVVIGGQYRRGIMSFVGPYAVRMLEELHADRGFIGINGYTLEEGLTTPNPYEAEMKRTIISRCRECFLMADSRKYGTVYMSKVADIGELDGIITDDELPKNVARNMQEHGIHLY